MAGGRESAQQREAEPARTASAPGPSARAAGAGFTLMHSGEELQSLKALPIYICLHQLQRFEAGPSLSQVTLEREMCGTARDSDASSRPANQFVLLLRKAKTLRSI